MGKEEFGGVSALNPAAFPTGGPELADGPFTNTR